MTDKTIRELQTSLPWTIRYSRDYRANPQSHKDFAHALVHVSKALGHLMGLCDDMDHDREVADDPKLREKYGKYVADLVVCALRASNTFPGGVLDLQSATEERIVVKNQPSAPIAVGDSVWVPQEPLPATKPVRQPIKDDLNRLLWSPPTGADHKKYVVLGDDGVFLGRIICSSNQIEEQCNANMPGWVSYQEAQPYHEPVVKREVHFNPARDNKSEHWEARDYSGKKLGTFWSPENIGYDTGRALYPDMHTFHPITPEMPF